MWVLRFVFTDLVLTYIIFALQEACPGENDASNQEKTSEPMDSVGTDGVN